MCELLYYYYYRPFRVLKQFDAKTHQRSFLSLHSQER